MVIPLDDETGTLLLDDDHRACGGDASHLPVQGVTLMIKFLEVARTSEFWVAVLGAIITVLVSFGVLTKEAGDFVNMAAVYVFGRLVSKVAKSTIPVGDTK